MFRELTKYARKRAKKKQNPKNVTLYSLKPFRVQNCCMFLLCHTLIILANSLTIKKKTKDETKAHLRELAAPPLPQVNAVLH